MPSFGQVVVIKRNGTDGTHFPLTTNSCLFGRKKECDIRIQLPQVSKEHCKIEVNENKEAILFNLSSANPTQLNRNHFQDPIHLKHGDILTIIDRSFRFEYPPPSLPQKRLSRSQEKEKLQILHVQHMQQIDLQHPQNSDYEGSPITGKKCETCSPTRNEKRLQKQYSTPEFKYKMHSTEKANELSPFSKLYELMKHEDGTGNVKENTGNETLLEDVFHTRSRRSAVNRAKLTKEKHGMVASPIPTFEEKNSEKSSSIPNCDIQQKQECESGNQSDFKNIEDNEVGKCAHFKANQQSAQHFPEPCILSLDYAEKAKCFNKFNATDSFISVESTLPKAKPSRESTQNYSSPRSRKPRRSSRSRRTGVDIDSLNRMKSSGEMKESPCPVQVSGQEHESGILIETICSKTNENRELVTETALNLKDSEDGNSSTVFHSVHLNTSENCNNNIELNKTISNEYSCIEAIDRESIIPADLSQTSEIMANEIPEKTLETKCPTNENKKIGTESHEQNVNMKNNIPNFSSSYESRVQPSAKVNAVSEMNVLRPLNKKSEAKKSPQKRRGTELDFLVQSLGKRKRVSFAGQLSPELFDKRLPPNSPLKKGAIPARLSMPFGNSPRAVLKKAAELRQAVTQSSFEKKQYENIVSKQADSHSVPQRQQCVSDPHVASQSSEGEETTTQEMHINSLCCVSNATSSLRRSKPRTPRRSSICGKSGVMGTIHSKRRSGASEANLMVAKSWAEVVKQGVPKLQMKSASKQGFKTRPMKKVASKSPKKNNSLKTPKRKISGHFTTGHANSPAPIVIGKAHTGILNITAQVPKVVTNYPLRKHCVLNESFTGLPEMFCSPPNGKQKSFEPETQISEINASEEFEKKSVLDVNISSQKRVHNQDVISSALEKVSQIPIHDNLMVSLNERNMRMEEEKLQQELEPVRQLLEIKRLLKTTKERSEPVEVLSGDKRLLRTPKEKSEPDEALSAVKRLLRTPKEKSEPVEVLSGVKRLLRTPKQKSDPVEALSGVKRLFKSHKKKSESVEDLSGIKRLLRTPKQKSEPVEVFSGIKRLLKTPKESDEVLSGVKRLLRTSKEKCESVEALSGVKRLLRTPKQKSEPTEALSGIKRLFKSPKKKSEPIEDLSGIKRLFKTPKGKSESVEDLSGIKRLLETPEQKSEPVEVFSGIKMLKTPEQTMEPLADAIYTKSRLSTGEVLKDMIGSVTKNEIQIMEDTNINGIIEEIKETLKPIEENGSIQMMSPKQRFEPINNTLGNSQILKASQPKSMPTDDDLGLQKFMIEPKEGFIIPDIDYRGVKEILDTEIDKDKMPEPLNFVEENGSYTSSRNKLESMENVPGSCEANLEIKLENECHFPVTKNSSVSNHVGHVAFNELKTEFNKKTTRTISLSENYEPVGMSFKNEAKTDCVKEVSENSDALKIEKPEPLAVTRTRRRKTNDCSSAVYTKMIQRPTKNRSTSDNCEQISEHFDSHTELNPLHKSENNFMTMETTKLSQRGRPKKQHVETNGNIGSDNISQTQELEKPVKETAVEKQPVNRRKVATKRKGKTSMDLEENGAVLENESDLTVQTRLRSRNVKKTVSDVKTIFAKGKANDTISGEESNKRRKIAAIQSTPETLNTSLNADKQGTQKCTISKICKIETSDNKLTAMGKKFLEKKKKVQFLLKDNFKASEEKCASGYESNTHKEEESQTENICNGIPKVPLESTQTPAEPSQSRIKKLSKKNLPRRGRGKKSISNPSVESESKPDSGGKDHDVIGSLKENNKRTCSVSESMENVPGSCEPNLEIKFENECHFPVTKNISSVPNHVGHVAFNSFNELKTEFNKKTTRTISLSEHYEPVGMSFKNEAKTDCVKEVSENSDALKIEKPEPLAVTRTRRRKINDCSSAVYTKMMQRPTKNRSTSDNCEQISENFDSHTELNPLYKSENNFMTMETTKLSQRGRPKKQHVETNGNIGSDNISQTQELEKPVKETAVEKQPVNRRKVATKRKGKTSMDLEENGAVLENESDLTVQTRLRSRNVKKTLSDVKTIFAKSKANDTMSGEESNKRRKIAEKQSSPETITILNADKQGTQKCPSKMCKTEASGNNLTAMGNNVLEKKKKVQVLPKDDFKASEEKCAFGYENNTHKEEESQTENICNGIPKVPFESMQTSAEPSQSRIKKLSKNNLPRRGRGKKSISNPSVESESKPDSGEKNHDVIVSLKENQPKRGRGRNIDQVLLKSISSLPKRVVKDNPPRRGRSKQVNETSGNKEADVQGPNIAIEQEDNQYKRARGKRKTQESCSLKSQRTVKENPPKRGRHKKPISGDICTDSDSTHITPKVDENVDGKNACLAKEDQTKVSRRTRNTVVFQKNLSPVKNDTCHLLSSDRGEHSDEQPNEDLKTVNNANENFTYKCRKRKAVHEISANSVSSSKKSEVIDNDIQQNGKKDSKAVSKPNTSRTKRKRLTPCGTSAESNDELRINSKKSPLVTDNVGPLENSFGKKRQSKKQREETNTAPLVSPSLKVSITLSSANENQSGNRKESVGKRKLAKLAGAYNIMTRSLKKVH